MKNKVVALATLALSLTSYALHADSLRDIYELALENDAQLRAEQATYLAQRETEILSRSQLLPQISGSYSFQNSDVELNSISPSIDASTGAIVLAESTTDRDADTDGYRISLSQAIFDLPAWFSFRSGKEITREAEATFAANQQDLIVRVVEAYLSVLRSQDNLGAARAQERAFERQLEQTQQRFEVGLIAITDVYEAQAARDLAQVDRIVQENALSVALENLTVLTGQTHTNLHVLSQDFGILPPDPADRSEWVDFALANNFQLAASRHREEAARQSAKAKKLEHAPKILATYDYSDFDASGSSSTKPASNFNTSDLDGYTQDQTWKVALTVPLYTGGAVSSNRRKAAHEFNAAREQRVKLMRDTITNTRSLHMTVISDVSRVAARGQTIVSSNSALDATQAGYEVGTRNVVDVLNAQNALYSAQRDFANSRYDYVLNMLRLKQQAGLLSPDDINKLDDYLTPPPPPTAAQSK